MNIRSLFLIAAVLGLSTAAFAQTLDGSAGEAAAALAQRARDSRHGYDSKAAGKDFVAQGAPKEYARSIVCAHPPKDSGLSSLSFFTGLSAQGKRAGDDTASGLNDYRSSYVRDGKFHYDAWSCDTQDYWFTFDAESLLKTTPKEIGRAVKGHARIETRGQVDWEGDLDCVANF